MLSDWSFANRRFTAGRKQQEERHIHAFVMDAKSMNWFCVSNVLFTMLYI